MTHHTPPVPPRRLFLRRFLQAALASAGACWLGYGFWDRQGPRGPDRTGQTIQLADFSRPNTAGRIGIVRGPDRTANLHRAIESVGGIETYIQPGDRVLIKVNAAFASPPALSATTHPDMLAGTIALCRKAGAARIMVTDNPINDPASCFNLSGIRNAAARGGADLILPEARFFKSITLPKAQLIRNWPVLFEPFKNANKLIGLAPLKDHHRSGASMIMKNWYGFLGGRRNLFHQDIHNIIKELALMVRPTLVILDATSAMMTNGPTGGSLSDLKPTDTVIAGTDQVAVDAYGAELLGRRADEVPFIAKAAAEGVGTADYRSLAAVEINL